MHLEDSGGLRVPALAVASTPRAQQAQAHITVLVQVLQCNAGSVCQARSSNSTLTQTCLTRLGSQECTLALGRILLRHATEQNLSDVLADRLPAICGRSTSRLPVVVTHTTLEEERRALRDRDRMLGA